MSRKLVLITGGTSGIGRAVAESLAPTHDLALGFAADEPKAERALAELRHAHPRLRAEIFQRRLTGYGDCEKLYQSVGDTFGRTPLILVNSAGTLGDGLFLQTDFSDHQRVIGEHLLVPMALTRLAIRAMYNEKFGRVINLSSISANYAKRGQSSYAAAKAGIEGFTRTLALEVAHRGVTVNAIAPGLIETPMTRAVVTLLDASEVSLKKRIPAGRVGQPEEVGALAAFLCSEAAAYINGTVIPIDGGRSLGDPLS